MEEAGPASASVLRSCSELWQEQWWATSNTERCVTERGGRWWKDWIESSTEETATAVSCALFACGALFSSNVVYEVSTRTLHAAAAGGSASGTFRA